MSVLAAVVDALTPDDATATDEAFAYRCTNCDVEFERPKLQMVRIRCPDCGSNDVRSAD